MPLSREEARLRLAEINEQRAREGRPLLPVPTPKENKPRKLKAVPPTTATAAPANSALANPAPARPPTPANATIIAGDKWTGIPNDILDTVLRQLQPYDQVVLIRLYRLSWGFKKDWCEVGRETLATACNISKRQAIVSTSRLEAKGLIQRIKTKRTETARYRILLPPAIAKSAPANIAPATAASIKEKAVKEKELKSPQEHMTPEELAAYIESLEE